MPHTRSGHQNAQLGRKEPYLDVKWHECDILATWTGISASTLTCKCFYWCTLMQIDIFHHLHVLCYFLIPSRLTLRHIFGEYKIHWFCIFCELFCKRHKNVFFVREIMKSLNMFELFMDFLLVIYCYNKAKQDFSKRYWYILQVLHH